MEPLGETVRYGQVDKPRGGRRKILITARILQFSFAPPRGLSVCWFPPRVLPDRSSLGYYPTALCGLACPI